MGHQFAQLFGSCSCTINHRDTHLSRKKYRLFHHEPKKQTIYVVSFASCSPVALQDMPSLETLSVEMESLKRHLSKIDSPTVLCHNDLLTKNIVYNNKEGEEK